MSFGGTWNTKLELVRAVSREVSRNKFGEEQYTDTNTDATFSGIPTWVDFGKERRMQSMGAPDIQVHAVWDVTRWIQEQVKSSTVGRYLRVGDIVKFSESDVLYRVISEDEDNGMFGSAQSWRYNLQRTDYV